MGNADQPARIGPVKSGLAYNWHRHYDPSLGRYTQTDPLGFVDGPSIYAYTINSPQMYLDEDGRFVWSALIGGGVGAGVNIVAQLNIYDGNFDCVDWWGVGAAGVSGAISGGLGSHLAAINELGTFGNLALNTVYNASIGAVAAGATGGNIPLGALAGGAGGLASASISWQLLIPVQYSRELVKAWLHWPEIPYQTHLLFSPHRPRMPGKLYDKFSRKPL